MSDLVERLRRGEERLNEAADEIERLRLSRCNCDDECALSIENERLRALLQGLVDAEGILGHEAACDCLLCEARRELKGEG